MYLKDLDVRLEVRISATTYEWIDEVAKSFGWTRSEAVRRILDTVRAGWKAVDEVGEPF